MYSTYVVCAALDSLFNWENPLVTWAIACFNMLCLYLSVTVPIRSLLLILLCTIFAWYLAPFSALRYLFSRLLLHHRRKQNEQLLERAFQSANR